MPFFKFRLHIIYQNTNFFDQMPGLDCDKMNVENSSRKVVVCWYPTRRYWLDISDYTRYIPRVVTDGYRDHPKDGSSSTSHMKFWQEAGVQYKNTILTILNWWCSGQKSLLPTMTSGGPWAPSLRPRIAVGLFPLFLCPTILLAPAPPAAVLSIAEVRNNLLSLKSIKSAVGRSVFTSMTFCPETFPNM